VLWMSCEYMVGREILPGSPVVPLECTAPQEAQAVNAQRGGVNRGARRGHEPTRGSD